MKKEDLLVNGLKYPYGVDDRPVFSWKVEVSGYGSAQTAYQIIVCSDEEKEQHEVGNLWDSGKVMSENPYDVVYAGAALSSKTDYFWRVQTWNEKGECSGWSETAVFATGICRQEEWLGCWIGAGEHMPKKKAEDSPMSSPEEDKYSRRAPMLRKTFTVSGKVKSARLFVSGLGLFELEINGQRPDDSVLNPGNTQYTETVLYRAFDVTGLLAEGKNAIGVELGNSFYNEHTGVWKWQTAKWRDNPKLLLNLDIHYEDGRKETVVSDTSWKVYTNGPTVANSIYLGDVWDANLALPGWTEADFDDENWPDAQEAEAPSGKLICQTMPPVRRFCAAKAKTIEKIGPDSWIVEAPEMLSGWAKIRMKGAAGQKIRITYGEQRTENGQVAMTGDGKGMCGEWWPEGIIQQDQYICDGTERFWEPKFSYKGYRYVQVDGYEGELTADDVILYGLANEVETISDFKCSEKTLEKLHEIMVRTLRNNFLWNPHLGEKRLAGGCQCFSAFHVLSI